MSWIEPRPEGTLLRLLIQPRASRTEVVGPHGDPPRLKIRVAAPPVGGEANSELVRFLGKLLGVPKKRIAILRGDTGKTKDVLCEGAETDSVRALLEKGS